MLLIANLIMLVGIVCCSVAALHSHCRALSPLFENGLLVAIVGMVLSSIAALVEASGRLIELAGWFVSFADGGL